MSGRVLESHVAVECGAGRNDLEVELDAVRGGARVAVDPHAVAQLLELQAELTTRSGDAARASDLYLQCADAWDALRNLPETGRLADAVSRTVDSGAAVARALERLADALRTTGSARVESAAQRLGVLLVLPLGLCFLPAFVFAGIVPVIVAVLGGVLK